MKPFSILPLRVCTSLLGLALLAALGLLAGHAPLHIPLDVNEGWNAFLAKAVSDGGTLYPHGADRLIDNNYPPMSFYFAAALARLTGDAIFAGRLLALAGLVLTGVFTGLSGARLGAGRWESVFGGMVFPAAILAFSGYAGIDDPQILAHAFGTAGMYVLLRAPDDVRNQILAALILTLSGFIKHNLIALPLALGVWLALREKKIAIPFFAAGVAALLLGLGAFRIGFGFGLLPELMSPRPWVMLRGLNGLLGWLQHGFVLLILAAAISRIAPRNDALRFCLIFAGLALVIGTLLRGGEGVEINAFFEADIALALTTALVLSRWQTALPRGALLALLMGVLAAGAILKDSNYRARFNPEARAEREAVTARDIAYLKNAPSALCLEMALCYWADRSGFDTFNQEAGKETKSFAQLVRERRFAVLQTYSTTPFEKPEDMAALTRAYRLVYTSRNGAFFHVKP